MHLPFMNASDEILGTDRETSWEQNTPEQASRRSLTGSSHAIGFIAAILIPKFDLRVAKGERLL